MKPLFKWAGGKSRMLKHYQPFIPTEIKTYSEPFSPQQAATLYFLLKTSFNGIYQVNANTNGRFGMASGLLNEVGSVYDREVVNWWHLALQKVEICVGDWTRALTIDVDGSFTFLDPPYRGSFTSYGQEFDDERQREVVEFCKETSTDVFLCNRCVGDRFFEMEIVASDLKIERFDTTYTAGRRKRVDRTDDAGQEFRTFEAKKATEVLVHRSR